MFLNQLTLLEDSVPISPLITLVMSLPIYYQLMLHPKMQPSIKLSIFSMIGMKLMRCIGLHTVLLLLDQMMIIIPIVPITLMNPKTMMVTVKEAMVEPSVVVEE